MLKHYSDEPVKDPQNITWVCMLEGWLKFWKKIEETWGERATKFRFSQLFRQLCMLEDLKLYKNVLKN